VADIVFPAGFGPYEKDGTVTNTSVAEIPNACHKGAESDGRRGSDFDLLRILSHFNWKGWGWEAFHYKTPAASLCLKEIRKGK